MNKLRFNQLLESTMGNVRPLLVEQLTIGSQLGAIDCYPLTDIKKMGLGTSPSIEIGESTVRSITKEELGLWSVVLDLVNPSDIPPNAISEPQTSYELDIVPVSRFYKSQLNSENPIDSKEMVIITYDPTGQKHYCRAKNNSDQNNLIATNPSSKG